MVRRPSWASGSWKLLFITLCSTRLTDGYNYVRYGRVFQPAWSVCEGGREARKEHDIQRVLASVDVAKVFLYTKLYIIQHSIRIAT